MLLIVGIIGMLRLNTCSCMAQYESIPVLSTPRFTQFSRNQHSIASVVHVDLTLLYEVEFIFLVYCIKCY